MLYCASSKALHSSIATTMRVMQCVANEIIVNYAPSSSLQTQKTTFWITSSPRPNHWWDGKCDQMERCPLQGLDVSLYSPPRQEHLRKSFRGWTMRPCRKMGARRGITIGMQPRDRFSLAVQQRNLSVSTMKPHTLLTLHHVA